MPDDLRHGKWWDRWRGAPLAKMMEGRFDQLFDPACVPPARFEVADLITLADNMTADLESPPTAEGVVDSEENPGIEAAYTYLGQFLDHDITLDPTSHLRQFARNLDDLVDFRTPRFDLDSLYGRGPGDQPYLYVWGGGQRLLAGRPLSGNTRDPGSTDLPRGPSGRALIGDPRNDENRIVAQLHSTMIRFHNHMADVLNSGASFDEIRDQVRWHYQWVIVNDFLPTVVNKATVESVFPHLANGTSVGEDLPQLTITKLTREGRDRDGFLMPVEFSVAAYRFGHSMVRPIYRLNETISRRPIFSASPDVSADLGGMRPIPDDWAIDWQFFTDIGAGDPTEPDPNDHIKRVPQKAYKIDTSVVFPLGHLPSVVAADPASLPQRNLIRGNDFGLPSGQDVARALGLDPIPDSKLVIGKATDTKEDPKTLIADITPGFREKAPLWAYVLSEAQVTSWGDTPPPHDNVTTRLGPVGGRLVAEVFAAILLADQTSFLNANPSFTPRMEFAPNGVFGLAELINAVLGK